MKTLSRLLFLILFVIFIRCEDNFPGTDTIDKCALKPETGPCKALITKYYFDKSAKKCKSFTWGGCDGVVPFHTLEECELGCP